MSKIYSAIAYYITSIPTLIRGSNFFVIPLVFIKKPILMKLSGSYKFYVDNHMDIWTLKEVILDRQYERVRKIRKGDVVIDIGAGVGDFSILSSKKARTVYAFEIDGNRIGLLKSNLKINKCNNVDLSNKAINSLDEVFLEKKINRCNFLKIDCEGCEYPILLKTTNKTLRKIEFIAMETHLFNPTMKNKYKKLLKLLNKNNFQIKEFPNAVHSNIHFVFAYRN